MSEHQTSNAMSPDLKFFLGLAWETIQQPRDGARRFLDLGWPSTAVWPLLILGAVLGGVKDGILTVSAPMPPMFEGIPAFIFSPLGLTFGKFVLLAGMAFALYQVGRAMRGGGTFPEAILVLGWWQAIMVGLGLIQLLLFFSIPILAAFFQLIVAVLAIWLLVVFTAELHGFQSMGQAVFAVIMAAVGVGIAVTVLANLTGLTLVGGIPNA